MDDRYIETLSLINEFQQNFLYSPKLQELSDKLGISKAGISLRIKQIEKEGLIERLDNMSLRITQKGYDVLNPEIEKPNSDKQWAA
ncbi:MAG: MarR family transcriptional regulator [Deltaproteobacteria bacterium]|nr:MarR family transcriptional regulator [Deltaproteobacteria bacterium]